MRLALMHRRLTLLMALAALAAFVAGAGLHPFATGLTGAALAIALFWQPDPELSARLERIWLVGAAALVAWTLYQVFFLTDDVVAPIVALLLLLLVAEATKSLDARNDVRLYALSFALLVAATAYVPGIVFAAAFVAYVVLATLALMVGHVRRQAERHSITGVFVGRPFLTLTAALSGVTLVMSVLVFIAFPRLPRNWIGRGITTSGVQMAGFSDEVSLGAHGSRIYGNPEVVLRVEFPDGERPPGSELYWRGRSYDRFDGVRWSRSRRMPSSAAPIRVYRERWRGPPVRQRIYGGALDARVLFALHPAIALFPRSPIRPNRAPNGDLTYSGSAEPIYGTRSMRAPPARALRETEGAPAPAKRYYLQLPSLDDRVGVLADSLTAGLTTRYDRARAIERWLQTELDYTLSLPASSAETSIEHFLFERRAGHCEYFSTSMVVLLRSIGVPARNVNGFLGGGWNDFGRYLAVTQNDAHSWVEVWFAGIGWVRFDPTPASGGASGGAADQAWYWPAVLAFDGVQHRWNKWVITYDLEKQFAVFSGIGDLFSRSEQPERGGDDGEFMSGARGYVLWLLAVAATVWLIWYFGWRRRTRTPAVAREYLALRRAYDRAGYDPPEPTPLDWVGALRASGAPAAADAERLVRLYLRARFKGETLDDAQRVSMREALSAVRQALRGRR